jgi:hypothetical protein
VRTGYLAALASRAVGAAPVLKPPTPSLFEPESPQADWHDVVEVHQTARDQVAGSGGVPLRADETAADTILTAGPSPGGFFGPDLDQGHPAASADHSGAALGALEAAQARPAQDRRETPGKREAQPARPSGADPARAQGSAADTAGELVPGQVAWLAPDAAGGPAATEFFREPGMALSQDRRAPWPDEGASRPQDVPSWPQPAATGRPGGPTPAPGPAIVVRIGRVDVRAVQAAPPAAPAPRRRPSAGPSLEERLRARDRGRR